MTTTPLLDTAVKRKDDHYPVIVKIRSGNSRRNISTGFRIEKKYWNGKSVDKKHPRHSLINSKITEIISDAERYYADCMLYNRPVNIALIGTGQTSHSFNQYLMHRSKQFKAKGQIIMSKKVNRLIIELQECFGELYFDQINQDALRKLEAWQIDQGNANNTRVKKFAVFRQFYEHAIIDGKAPSPNPFKAYKIVSKPVKKEKLSVQEISDIENLSLQSGPVNDARNLFLFSYFCKGLRFENCVTAKKDQIKGDRIFFKTNKGNKFISVKIHSRLQAIIDQYKGYFIFPYISEIPEDKEDYISLVGTYNTIVNRYLKAVSNLANIKVHLTFHIARHTFADHLKKQSGNIQIIKESLGHSDTRTTEIYLAALGDEVLDNEMDKLYGG